MVSLGDISIGCGDFYFRYHATRVCLGLPDSINNTIKAYDGEGINFCCTSCRLEEGSDSNGPQSGSIVDGSRDLDDSVSEQAVKQLFETIKSLLAAVATLTNNKAFRHIKTLY